VCGIAGYYGSGNTCEVLLNSLKRLEYRGYDSAGIAVSSDFEIHIKKAVGELDDIKSDLDLKDKKSKAGIGHTRWATHGEVSEENAHPHVSCCGRFALVHNGILENWEEMKRELGEHRFTSETDSEVVVHFIEQRSQDGCVETAIREFMKEAKGSYSIAVLDSKREEVFVMKNGSPMAIGIGSDGLFFASDIHAFSEHTENVVFLDDNEYATVRGSELVVKNHKGKIVDKQPKTIKWSKKSPNKKNFEHYMYKEINEIPSVLRKLEKTLDRSQKNDLNKFRDMLKEHEKIIFTASGTSYHASLLGVYFLQKAGIEAQALIASEFKNYERADDKTLLVPVSQSGETKDVIEAVNHSRKKGADIASITNVPHSTIERMSDVNLRINAGQEICVAATKTFINQLYTIMRLSSSIDGANYNADLANALKNTIQKNEDKIKELAEELSDEEDLYIIGKGEAYPIAREIALKLKEIAYIHAEGMMAGELKHGTLALIEDNTPVVSLIPDGNSSIASNVKEVESRGANTIKLSPHNKDFWFPERNESFVFASTILGFLLTYWIAKRNGLPIDKPRNLAKSVTVQ